MKLISLKCNNCGSTCEVDKNKEIIFCQYCGNKMIIDHEIHKTEIINSHDSGYEFEKGRQQYLKEIEEKERIKRFNEQQERLYEEQLEHEAYREIQDRKNRNMSIFMYIVIAFAFILVCSIFICMQL